MSQELVPLETAVVATDTAQHPVAVYLARLSEGSRRAQAAALETVARIVSGGRLGARELPWGELRYQHTQAIRAVLTERYAPATANRHLAALRGVLREAWRLGQLDGEAYQRAADLPSVRGSRLPAGRSLSGVELLRLFEVCAQDETAAGARDAALLALLYGAGLRRAEVVALDLDNYDPQSGALRVRGKGDRERVAYAAQGAQEALDSWTAFRGKDPGPLLCPVDKRGRVHVRRLTSQAVLLACRKRASQAGLDRFSPHDLRRTFIGDLLDAGADLSAAQQLAGHASVTTTARYDRRGERSKQRAAARIHVPYRR